MRAFAFLAVILLTTSLAFAQTVFHPASEVANGTFGSSVGGGNYTFNNSMFVVDKLGVGTTSPGNYKFLVHGDGAQMMGIESSNSWANMFIKGGQVGDAIWELYSGSPLAGDFSIRESGVATYVTIKKTIGNVGIGTTSPQNKLDVEGGAVIGATYSGTNTAPTNGLLVEGRIGIGTTVDEGAKLIVKSTPPQLYLQTTSDALSDSIGFLNLAGASVAEISAYPTADRLEISKIGNAPIVFRTASIDRVTIAGSGNVGIGTTSPVAKLDIRGGGISIDGGGISIGGTPQKGVWNSRVPLSNVATTVDSTNGVGRGTSVTIGADGLPVISYIDSSFNNLKVVKCGNSACSSGNTITTADSTQNVGGLSSIAIGTDGLPVITYNLFVSGLRVLKCGNAFCSANNTNVTIGAGVIVTSYPSIAIGIDGLPVISYNDDTNSDLKVLKCGNVYCNASNTNTTVDSAGYTGYYTSIAIGIDGLPIIAYYNGSTNLDLMVAKCGNAYCNASNTITRVDTTGDVGLWPSITIGTDGLPIISYFDNTNLYLKVAKCGNIACSGNNTITIADSTFETGRYTSITIGTDGLPIISYTRYEPGGGLYSLKALKCGNVNCSFGNVNTTVDSSGGPTGLGTFTSIAIGADGLPVISYYSNTAANLKVAKCGSERCMPYWTRR